MRREKTLLRTAAEGFAITATGDLLAKVFGIVTTFIVLAWLTPYDYGLWRLLQSVVTGMSLITLSGVTGIIVADIARELGAGRTQAAQTVIWRTTQLFVSTGILAAGLLFIAAPVISTVSGINLTVYLWILALSIGIGSVFQVSQILFQARLQPIHGTISKNLGNIAYLMGIGFLVAQMNLGILGLVIAYGVSVSVPALVYLPYLLRQAVRARSEHEVGSYKLRDTVLKRGKWALANDYVSILVSALWPWITGYFLGIEAVGYAGLAIVLISQVFSLVPFQYILRAILPRFSDDAGRMQEWVQRGLRYSLWIHIIAGVAVIGAAALLFPILFPVYGPVIPIAALLLLSVPFRAMSAVLTEWFYATSSQKELFMSTAVPKLVALALLPPLLIWFGLYGFVAWYVLSSDAVLIFRMRKVKRELNIRTDMVSLFKPDQRDWQLLRHALREITGSVRQRFGG